MIKFRCREDVLAYAVKVATEQHTGQVFTSPCDVKRFLQIRFAGETREHFDCIFLDTKHAVISTERLFSGTVDGAQVHPRIILQRALALNAVAIIIAHNHPSGNPEPSAADRAITARIREACLLLEVRLLDHIVIGTTATSFAERGLL